jgi:predicted nucleotidyltransferase
MGGRLPIEPAVLAAVCRQHGIRRLLLFGSVLKGSARPDSDLLVEFEAGRTPGLLGLSAIELELGRLIGRKVDLRTADDLSTRFRDDVLRQAEVVYET